MPPHPGENGNGAIPGKYAITNSSLPAGVHSQQVICGFLRLSHQHGLPRRRPALDCERLFFIRSTPPAAFFLCILFIH